MPEQRTGPVPCQEITGPAPEGTPAKTSTFQQHPTTRRIGSPSPDEVKPLALRWATTLINGAAGDIHEYGSPEWHALPDDSREKVAGCVLAAEAWRTRHARTRDVDIRPGTRRAREVAEARRPREGDHMGGAVQW